MREKLLKIILLLIFVVSGCTSGVNYPNNQVEEMPNDSDVAQNETKLLEEVASSNEPNENRETESIKNQNPNNTEQTSGEYNTYVNSRYGYSLKYPKE